MRNTLSTPAGMLRARPHFLPWTNLHAATSKVENSAQGSSCQLKFIYWFAHPLHRSERKREKERERERERGREKKREKVWGIERGKERVSEKEWERDRDVQNCYLHFLKEWLVPWHLLVMQFIRLTQEQDCLYLPWPPWAIWRSR